MSIKALKIIFSINLAILTLDIYLQGIIRNVCNDVCACTGIHNSTNHTLKNWKQAKCLTIQIGLVNLHVYAFPSTFVLLPFGTRLFSAVGCPVHCGVFGSTPDLYPPMSVATPSCKNQQ